MGENGIVVDELKNWVETNLLTIHNKNLYSLPHWSVHLQPIRWLLIPQRRKQQLGMLGGRGTRICLSSSLLIYCRETIIRRVPPRHRDRICSFVSVECRAQEEN